MTHIMTRRQQGLRLRRPTHQPAVGQRGRLCIIQNSKLLAPTYVIRWADDRIDNKKMMLRHWLLFFMNTFSYVVKIKIRIGRHINNLCASSSQSILIYVRRCVCAHAGQTVYQHRSPANGQLVKRPQTLKFTVNC